MSEIMKNQTTGPILTDELFFSHCLNLDYEGMEEVKKEAECGNYSGARAAFASYVRRTLEPKKFFTIPYEKPENIFKYPDETDEEACERILNHILISVGVPCDYGRENSVDWYHNPTYNQYKEWTWQLSRHNDIKLIAHQYNQKPDPRYPALAAELFESWVKQAVTPGDVDGHDTKCWRTIECGIRMGANWPYILFTFYKTEAFTDDVLVDWYKSVWEHGDRLSRNRTHGNWLIMEMNGLAQIGILYPQFKRAKEWLDLAFASLVEELDKQIYADGFQYELSTCYHDVVIKNYQRLIQVAEAFSVEVPSAILDKLLLACEANIKIMMPDGKLPDINDGGMGEVAEILEPKLRMFPQDEKIRWAVSKGREGTAPEYLSVPFPDSGFFVMRNGWDPDSTWAFLDAAPFGREHQHEDKLSLLMYACGKMLLTEGGNYAYDDSEMRKYVLSTRSHNTVMVDGESQNRLKNYSWKDEDIKKKADLKWSAGEAFDYCESNYNEGYGELEDTSINHNRSVYFIKNPGHGLMPFFLVADRLTSEESHRFELLYHIDSDLEQCTMKHVSFADLEVCVSSPASVTVVNGREEPEWQGFIATGTKQGMYRPVNCVIAETEGNNLRLVTVLAPCKSGSTRIVAVEAGKGIHESSMELVLSDGTRLVFDEEEMKDQK